jgi:hypothetical protein
MPKVFTIKGYSIYIWSNENNEPIHFHVSKGKPRQNAPKFWITSSGGILATNNNRIPTNDLKIIMQTAYANIDAIKIEWLKAFGTIRYYC